MRRREPRQMPIGAASSAECAYTCCDLRNCFDSKIKAQAYLGLLCCLAGWLGSATLPLLIVLLVIYVRAALRRVLLCRILRSLLLP